MFTCIACTKAEGGEEVEGARGSGTPSTKEAVKSLTSQVLLLSLFLTTTTTFSLWHLLSLALLFQFPFYFGFVCENEQNHNPN